MVTLSVDLVTAEDLRKSKKAVGPIYPIIKSTDGTIIDGKHRSEVSGWPTRIVDIKDPLKILQLRVHANMLRRDISRTEKEGWIAEAYRLLEQKLGRKPLLEEVASKLGLSHSTVNIYHVERQRKQDHPPHVPLSYFRPCDRCGSTSKLCNEGCDCARCLRLEKPNSAPSVDYDRQPILELKLYQTSLRNFTVAIPHDVARRLGWEAGDTLYASVVGKSMTLIKK
jgi:hypothetical protein